MRYAIIKSLIGCSVGWYTGKNVTEALVLTRKDKEAKNQETVQKIFEQSIDLNRIQNQDCVVWFDHSKIIKRQTFESNIFKVLDAGATPIYKKIDHSLEISDVLEQLKWQNNRIKAVIISVHGSPTNMYFDNNLKISFSDPYTKEFMRSTLLLERGASLILFSCSTGDERKGVSFARKISCYSPHIKVYAPNDITNCIKPIFTSNENREIVSFARFKYITTAHDMRMEKNVSAAFIAGKSV